MSYAPPSNFYIPIYFVPYFSSLIIVLSYLSLIFTYSYAVIEGDMGLLIWDMLCLAALTGLLSFLDLTLLHLVVELCVVVLWLAVHVQLRRKVCVCVCL